MDIFTSSILFFLEKVGNMNTLTFILVCFLLVFEAGKSGMLSIIFGKKKEESIPQWGAKLTQYANHDTTERLEKLITMGEKAATQMDDLKSTLTSIDFTLKEFKEYGIKTREK